MSQINLHKKSLKIPGAKHEIGLTLNFPLFKITPSNNGESGAIPAKLTAKNLLFHPFRRFPAEAPGSEGVRGEVGDVLSHLRQESPGSDRRINDFHRGIGVFS